MIPVKLLLISVVPVVISNEETSHSQPKVVTPSGTFLGSTLISGRQTRTILTFTGIPYAKPPLGHLRFANPVAYGKHTDMFNATKESPECLQWDHLRGRSVVGDEDCLYLNVFTNKIPQPPNYYDTQPTVVFLHAGTWLAGGGAWDIFQPDYLLESDVTVVTVNHRLGPLGFLSTEDEESPGNYGLRDLILCLEWVRDNVRYFGGMNDSVTVMGSGAGGISAHILTMSPLTRGSSLQPDEYSLLTKAISHSGTAYSPHAFSRDSKLQAQELAMAVGCASISSKDMISCLRSLPATKIIEKIPGLFEWDEEPFPFGPVIDSWMGSEAVLPDEPFHLIKKRQFLQVPWIAGTNQNDGAFRVQALFKDPSLVRQLNKDWDKYGPILLHLRKSCKDPVDVAKKIRTYYMGKKTITEDSAQEFVNMLTDRFFTHPTDHAMKDHCSNLRDAFCYRYQLTFSGRKFFLDILHQDSPLGAARAAFGVDARNPRFQNTRDTHGWGVSFLDELLYLFPSPKLNFMYQQAFNSDEASRVSTHMLMLWGNFIKGGDPTPTLQGWPEDMSPWGTWWEPFVKGYLYYLKIDPLMESQEKPLKEEDMAFWNDLPLFENRDSNAIRDEL